MGYQVSRWYDKNPRLGFAMQLMQLSPAEVQAEAVHEIEDVLDTLLADFTGETPLTSIKQLGGRRNRWYDRIPAAAHVFEKLKASPESLQRAAAEKLLTFFDSSQKA